MKFRVQLQRKMFASITIDAADENEAWNKAEAMADDVKDAAFTDCETEVWDANPEGAAA